MKGLVLAAGSGSRLGTATHDRPKALVEVAGATLLARAVRALRAAGADEVGVVVGWRADRFAGSGFTTFHNPAWETTSMVESLATASAWLATDRCLVVYGDVACEGPDLARLARAEAPVAVSYLREWRAVWASRFDDPLDDAETFRCAPDGRLEEIGARPQSLDQVRGQYLGLLHVTPQGWAAAAAELRRPPPPRHLTDLLQRMVVGGQHVQAVPLEGLWWEFDTPKDLELGEQVVRTIDEKEARP